MNTNKTETNEESSAKSGNAVPHEDQKEDVASSTTSPEAQRQNWVKLRDTINQLVDNLTKENVAQTATQLLEYNVIRGRGLLCRGLLKSVVERPESTASCAALTSVLTSRIPEIGELLLCKVVCLFKRAYVTNQKRHVDCVTRFLCELTIHRVVDEILLLQILQVLLEKSPTDDSVRVAIQILRRAGGYLSSHAHTELDTVFDRLRSLLQSDVVSPLSQKRITEILRLRRDGLKSNIEKCLDLVEEDDKEPILLDLSEKLDPQLQLCYFSFDPHFSETEHEYVELKSSIFPDNSPEPQEQEEHTAEVVTDMTNGELVQRQKNIYLTIMSSMSADEAVHKLMKLVRKENMERGVLIDMLVKCCAQEKTYSKYFGVIGEKICRMGNLWHMAFVEQFREKYDTIYQYEGAQLRNIGKFFGHLLAADILSLPPTLGHIVLTEENTNSAGRVFIKFLFQEMVEELGVSEVKAVLQDEAIRGSILGLFPVTGVDSRDADHLMFSINFFTAIGLGVLTEEMRSVLKNLPPEPRGRKRTRTDSFDYSSRSGSYSRSRSYSGSSSYSRSRSRSYSRSRSRSRSRSYSRSRSRSRSNSRPASPSRSPSRN